MNRLVRQVSGPGAMTVVVVVRLVQGFDDRMQLRDERGDRGIGRRHGLRRRCVEACGRDKSGH